MFAYRHHLLIRTAVGGRRKRQKKAVDTSTDAASAVEVDHDDSQQRDSRGLSREQRRALLLVNPLVDASGKRKSNSKSDRGVKLPLTTLAIGSRVRLEERLGFYTGLIPGATGTVIQFVYSEDAILGPALPGADMNAAIQADEQPQLPLVFVQFDAKYYNGPSCHPTLPRVVPIYATTCNIEYNNERYVREQLPLRPANACTVHLAQGTSTKQHVMCPPGAPFADFTRALFYVAISRCTTLAELYLILYQVTPIMFTKHKAHLEDISKEYERLRLLPKWRESLLESGAAASL